jgi:perosamine synthetase
MVKVSSKMKPKLPYGRQWIDDDDVEAVVDALRSDWLTTGPRVADFEAQFARAVGAKHAVAVSSGTAALHAAAFAAGIDRDSEVIVPPMTFAATANCVRYQSGQVVFADVLPDSLLLDVRQVLRRATDRTRAVIVVDYGGQPGHLDDLISIARERGWTLIEDAAHSLGATYRNRLVGSVADLTTFSLHPVKHITTGEGGVVTTNDDGIAERLRAFRNHGITTDHRYREERGSWLYEMTDLGYNYRITDFQCALGASQLRRLSQWVSRRQAIALRYDEAFGELPVDALKLEQDRTSSRHLYILQLRLEKLRVDRRRIFEDLRANGLGVNVHYIPVHYHPYYQGLGYRKGICPVAEEAYERLITIPLYPKLTDSDITRVIETVSNVIASHMK